VETKRCLLLILLRLQIDFKLQNGGRRKTAVEEAFDGLLLLGIRSFKPSNAEIHLKVSSIERHSPPFCPPFCFSTSKRHLVEVIQIPFERCINSQNFHFKRPFTIQIHLTCQRFINIFLTNIQNFEAFPT
jgi:hypothetical protein